MNKTLKTIIITALVMTALDVLAFKEPEEVVHNSNKKYRISKGKKK